MAHPVLKRQGIPLSALKRVRGRIFAPPWPQPPITGMVGSVGSTATAFGPTVTQSGITPPPTWTPRIGVSVYDRSGGFITDLPDAFGRTFQDLLDVEGSGSCSIPYWVTTQTTRTINPEVAAVPYRSLMRFSVDNAVRFSALVEHRVSKVVDSGEEPNEELAFSGRGILAILEEALIYPSGGVGRSPFSDTRSFDHTSAEYDDSGWGPASQLVTQGDTNNSYPWIGLPASFPDPTAWWIWGYPGAPLTIFPLGDNYFRYSFTLAQDTLVRIFYGADNEMTLAIDGVSYTTSLSPIGTVNTSQVDVLLTAGTHLIAVKGTNIPFPVGSGSPPGNPNPAAIILSAYVLSGDGTLGSLLFHTDNTWKSIAYPPRAPGFTVGQVMRILVQEAQARGALGYVTLGFTDTADSNGVPWPSAPHYYQIGSDLLATVKAICQVDVNVRMGPATPTLQMYVAGSLGAASGVSFTPEVNLTSLDFNGQA